MEKNELHRSLCAYDVYRADNGFVFGWYDMVNDEYHTVIAFTPEALCERIMAWQAERCEQIKRTFEGWPGNGKRVDIVGPNGRSV